MSKLTAIFFLILLAFASAASTQTNHKLRASARAEISDLSRARIAPRSAKSAASISSTEKETFNLINRERADARLQPLVWNEQLAAIARLHSRDMAESRLFSHRGSDGSMVDDRADKLGIHGWRAIGENIAFMRGFEDPANFAVDRWMRSAEHRRNLLDRRWNETGVGVAILPDGSYYFTQVFLLRN